MAGNISLTISKITSKGLESMIRLLTVSLLVGAACLIFSFSAHREKISKQQELILEAKREIEKYEVYCNPQLAEEYGIQQVYVNRFLPVDEVLEEELHNCQLSVEACVLEILKLGQECSQVYQELQKCQKK